MTEDATPLAQQVAALALAVEALATIVEEVLATIWTGEKPDSNRLGHMRILAHVARGQAESLSRPEKERKRCQGSRKL